MGVTFFETMSGELLDTEDHVHRVVIDIRCEASRLTSFVRNGRATVTGTATVDPWTDGAWCEGCIEIRPARGRRISYDVTFRDRQGRQWRLHGRKSLSGRHPVVSMTTMEAQLDCEGVPRASGVLQFQLDDLLPFLLSWRLGPTVRPARDAAAEDSLITDRPLGRRERETLAAAARTIVVPGGAVPAVNKDTLLGAERLVAQMPPNMQLAVRAGLGGLNATARGRYGRPFPGLAPAQRERVVRQLRGTGPGALLMLAVGMPVKMVHFGRRDYQDRIGMSERAQLAPAPQPRWMAAVVEPEEMAARTTLDCDVVVVGTGAGGAAAAASLAEQGHGVVMVEEGRYFDRSDFSAGVVDRLMAMWRDGGLSVGVGNTPVGVPVGRTVGGSTTINSGVAIRTPDSVLQEWLAAGFPADFHPESFARWSDLVESELGVSPGDPRYLGQVAGLVARGAEQMGVRHGALPRNAPGCDGQGQCVLGCPTDAKRSANVSWVPRALRAGAGLYSGLPVARILMHGDRAVGVLAQGQDRYGAPRQLEVRAKAVLVAGGALFTPLLLQRNGTRLPMLGRNLSVHPALGMMVRLPEDGTRPWEAIPMGYYADSRTDALVKHEGYYMPPEMLAATMPFDGPRLTGWMDDWNKVGQFGFMVRDSGVGSVSAGPGGRPLVRYSVSPRVLRAFHRGSAELAEMLLRGGGTEVETRIEGIGSVTDVHSARAIADARLPARAFHTMGFHPLGTARMGRSPSEAVVDFDHQVYGKRDLYVVDGAAVPSSLGVNPQVTIMAMALRAAEVIGERLHARSDVLPDASGGTSAGSSAARELQPA